MQIRQFIPIACVAVTLVLANGAAAYAQNGSQANTQAGSKGPAQAGGNSSAQFDLAGSFYEAFNSSTTGNGTAQTPVNATGGMLEGRYIASPLVGFEMAVSFNSANQTFAPDPATCAAHYSCANPKTALTVLASELTGDYVVSKRYGNLRPFALGGIGFFITSPGRSIYGVQTVVRPVFVYGGGLDYNVTAHLGLRVQYRGNVYKAPDLSNLYTPTGVYTESKEPTAGVFYSF